MSGSMFSAKGKTKVFGGNFFKVEDNAQLDLLGEGGGLNIVMGGNTTGLILENSLNDNSTQQLGGSTYPRHGPGSGSVTRGLMGQRSVTTVGGHGPGAATITVIGDINQATIRDSGNDTSFTKVAPGNDASDSDSDDSDDDEDVGGLHASIPKRVAKASKSSKARSDLVITGGTMSMSSYGSYSSSHSTFSAHGVTYSNDPAIGQTIKQFTRRLKDEHVQQQIAQGLGGPSYHVITAGSQTEFVRDGEKTIHLDAFNITDTRVYNSGNDNSVTEC